jgi:hypothetical protein
VQVNLSGACDGAGSDGGDKQENRGLAELIYQDALPFQKQKQKTCSLVIRMQDCDLHLTVSDA